MNMENPLVTVLMPVYNGEKYLREAIESILNQTFTDFEFLIINDGSTDNTKEIILSYNDKRIRYIENETNIKLIDTLNKGIKLAKGKYIARMDCDDISLPKRLEKQVDFMERNPDITVCGTHLKTIGSGIASVWKTAETQEEIICNMLFNSPMNHPTVVFRKEELGDYLYYSKDYPHAEDYELWFRLSERFKLANLDSAQYLYRIHSEQVTSKFDKIKIESANKVRKSLLLKILPDANEDEIEFHLKIASNLYSKSNLDFGMVRIWFDKLLTSNKKTNYFNDKAFKKVLTEKWVEICIANRNIPIWFKSLWDSLFARNSLSFISMKMHTLKILSDYFKKIMVKNG